MKPVFFLLSLLSFLNSAFVQAQNRSAEPFLRIEGEVAKSLNLTAVEFTTLKRTEQRVKDRDGKEYTYSGVALADLLRMAGATLGEQLKADNLAKYLTVQASDGYEVVFALPELDPAFTDRVIFLADRRDGQPLPEKDGPLRLVVPDEKKHAQWVRQVIALKVSFAK